MSVTVGYCPLELFLFDACYISLGDFWGIVSVEANVGDFLSQEMD